MGGDRNHHRISSPVFGQQSAVGELLFHPIRVRPFLVDLIDGHHDGNLGQLGVIDGFQSLRHDAIVGGDNEDHNVGDPRAAGPHSREGFMSRRVDENDTASVVFDVVGSDGLRDAADLAFGDICFPDRVEQRGFAVIDVAHHSHHGSARKQVAGVFGLLNLVHRFFFEGRLRGRSPELLAQVVDHLQVEGLVDGREQTAINQCLDDQVRLDAQLFGQLFHGRAFADRYLLVDRDGSLGSGSVLAPQQPFFPFSFAVARRPCVGRARPARVKRRPRPGRAGCETRASHGMHGPRHAWPDSGTRRRHTGHGPGRLGPLVDRFPWYNDWYLRCGGRHSCSAYGLSRSCHRSSRRNQRTSQTAPRRDWFWRHGGPNPGSRGHGRGGSWSQRRPRAPGRGSSRDRLYRPSRRGRRRPGTDRRNLRTGSRQARRSRWSSRQGWDRRSRRGARRFTRHGANRRRDGALLEPPDASRAASMPEREAAAVLPLGQ